MPGSRHHIWPHGRLGLCEGVTPMMPYSTRRSLLPVLAALLLTLTACVSAGGQEPLEQEPEVTTLIYANLTEGEGIGPDREAIERFNKSHTDVQIEVRNYYAGEGKSGKERLLTEMLAGDIPDIIDLGFTANSYAATLLPYRSLAQKGYLEDLWPYIESDPDLGRDGVLEAPLKAAEIDGGLYTVFSSVSFETLAGPVSRVGDRYSWTLDELREAYAAMPEGSDLLHYYTNHKRDLFYYLSAMLLEGYVDWDTGECSFESESFRDFLEFISSFPEEEEIEEAGIPDDSHYSEKRVASGQQLLVHDLLALPADIQLWEKLYGEQIAYVGFPVADGSMGSYFHPSSTRLCISTACKDKEAAWEYVRQMLLPRYDAETIWRCFSIPVNRADYDRMIKFSQSGAVGRKMYAPPGISIRGVTKEELARYEDFLNSIDKIQLYDASIYNIIEENATAYFAGDKTLDEAVDLIQRRVALYVSENM